MLALPCCGACGLKELPALLHPPQRRNKSHQSQHVAVQATESLSQWDQSNLHRKSGTGTDPTAKESLTPAQVEQVDPLDRGCQALWSVWRVPSQAAVVVVKVPFFLSPQRMRLVEPTWPSASSTRRPRLRDAGPREGLPEILS
jgi:hypothetical protein